MVRVTTMETFKTHQFQAFHSYTTSTTVQLSHHLVQSVHLSLVQLNCFTVQTIIIMKVHQTLCSDLLSLSSLYLRHIKIHLNLRILQSIQIPLQVQVSAR